jgi:hypothetical protein
MNLVNTVKPAHAATSIKPTCSICGVIVSMLSLSAVDRGFIGGVIVSMLSLSAVDRGFIGGVIVSMLSLSAVDQSNPLMQPPLLNPPVLKGHLFLVLS